MRRVRSAERAWGRHRRTAGVRSIFNQRGICRAQITRPKSPKRNREVDAAAEFFRGRSRCTSRLRFGAA
jgi:hypothetical protein